jgi:hypothetical protein
MSAAALSSNELRQSSIAGEYYFGDFPGTLQYSKNPAELKALTNLQVQDSDCGYLQIPALPEYLNRFIPNTKTGKASEWELLVVFQRNFETEIWMKAALKNKATGHIALMTSTNAKDNIERRKNRALKSLDPAWFIGFYRMAAPMVFWRAVVAAL